MMETKSFFHIQMIQDLILILKRAQLGYFNKVVRLTAQPLSLVKEVTANEVLRHRTLPLLGSQVDSIFYCTLSSGFGLFTHNTKVGEVFNKKVGIVPYNITRELIDKGTDPLQIMVEFCRKNGIEIFWSMRMNDTHDVSHKPE